MTTLRRTVSALVLVSAALLVGEPASAAANLEDFTIAPPTGYSVSTDIAPMLGVHTAEELSQLSGQPLGGIPEDLAQELRVLFQAWDAPDGSRGLAMVWEAPSDADGSQVLAGSLDSAGSEEFDTGVAGQFGRIVRANGATAFVILWQQGRYATYVFGTSTDSARGEALARDIAARQLARMNTVLGPSVAIITDPASDPVEKSYAYRAGQVTAVVVIVGGIVLIVVLLVKRSKAKQLQRWMSQSGPIAPPPAGVWSGPVTPWSAPAQPPAPPDGRQLPPPPPPASGAG